MTTKIGKSMRLKRVIDPAGVSVICALDHGMTSPTFLEPLADIEARTRETVAGGANVIMMSKGMIRIAEPGFSPTTSLALLLSASADPGGDRPEIVQIAEVEEALVLGADAVVLFTALGGETEVGMIDILSSVGRECAALGMPFIAEAEFPTTYATVEELKQQYGFEYLRRNVRLCAELGRRRLAARGQGAVVADAGRRRGGGGRLLRRAEHLHARLARGDHPCALARDPRAVERGQGQRGALGGARVVSGWGPEGLASERAAS
jgi:hypothetical protein